VFPGVEAKKKTKTETLPFAGEHSYFGLACFRSSTP